MSCLSEQTRFPVAEELLHVNLLAILFCQGKRILKKKNIDLQKSR